MNTLNTRIIHTHDIQATWDSENLKTFIPRAGEIIVYDTDRNFSYERIKIGDGIHNVLDLPFCIDAAVLRLLNFNENTAYLDAGRITDYTVTDTNQ